MTKTETLLDEFRAKLPETVRFRWIADKIAIIQTPTSSFIVLDFELHGFQVYQELPNESISTTLQRITN